ncbi:EMC4 isoform 3 [Pan troglodytes]|uniref:ER membrane protein complex subunit 4 n=3 Tax=Hominidae TaxID=9604 RepID=H0YMH5_HUMAN|nr:ER membrane protein complex subunit 4 [Homo sapiens]KAI4057001.1 ER membrane protein complex subunit 4 [Homo sapiens]PNI20023.1 EMC4 isoform 3 [Pan troglodytes]PNJ08382.1 EMC4 isoform 3 [Pongo abelii]
MTAQGGLVANRGRRFKWAIELSGPGGGSRETRSTQSVTWTSKCLIPACKRQTGSWWRSAAGTSPWVPSNRFP